MKKEKSVKGSVRLLTEKERNMITSNYGNVSKVYYWGAIIIFLGILALISVFLGMQWGTKMGIIVFGGSVVFGGVLIAHHLFTLRWVVNKARANELYAAEAIYLRESGKYNHVCLKEYKSEYVCKNFLVREPLKKGDRVIVLEMRGQAWIYKARK